MCTSALEIECIAFLGAPPFVQHESHVLGAKSAGDLRACQGNTPHGVTSAGGTFDRVGVVSSVGPGLPSNLFGADACRGGGQSRSDASSSTSSSLYSIYGCSGGGCSDVWLVQVGVNVQVERWSCGWLGCDEGAGECGGMGAGLRCVGGGYA